MGSGKTAVGRQLAKELGLEFFDSDAEIESSTGVDISFIFEKEGETSFRQRERDCITKLTQRENIVLATGGGSVVDEDIRRNLAQNGTVIYLKTSAHPNVLDEIDTGLFLFTDNSVTLHVPASALNEITYTQIH